MTIKSLEEIQNRGIELDLSGPEGNAMNIIGMAQRLAGQLGKNKDMITEDMMSGDYEHLIEVFEKHFGTVVTIYR